MPARKNTMTGKSAGYTVLALYRKKIAGDYHLRWEDIRSFSSRKDAVEYAKSESSVKHRGGRTGHYMVEKYVMDSMYLNGKKIR